MPSVKECGFFGTDCSKHIGLLWIAVFVAWLATGAIFLTGTIHSRSEDDRIYQRVQQIENTLYKVCVP